MDKVFEDIIKNPIILKKTSNIYKEDLSFENAARVTSYYIEKNKKFTWLKQFNNNLYIYGDPFPKYNFG
tara:strand:+ start:4406 stop:4612 length:207 start_codon:yes stop_codon:yes gene_type:complete